MNKSFTICGNIDKFVISMAENVWQFSAMASKKLRLTHSQREVGRSELLHYIVVWVWDRSALERWDGVSDYFDYAFKLLNRLGTVRGWKVSVERYKVEVR